MSSLRWGLLFCGIFLILLVWLYNLWDEYRSRKKLSKSRAEIYGTNNEEKKPNGLGGLHRFYSKWFTRRKPILTRLQDPILDGTHNGENHRYSITDDLDYSTLPELWADSVIDVQSRLIFETPLAVHDLWETIKTHQGPAPQPILIWMGYDDVTQEWELLGGGEDAFYRHYVVARQLVNKDWVLSESDLRLHCALIEAIAHAHHGKVEYPQNLATLAARADALDQLCIATDVQLEIRIAIPAFAVTATLDPTPAGAASPENVAGSNMEAKFMAVLAQAHNLRWGDNKNYHALDNAGNTLFAVSSLAITEMYADKALQQNPKHTSKVMPAILLLFSLDVPRLQNGPVAFDRMVELAQQIARQYKTELIDSKLRPLTAELLTRIRAHLAKMQDDMRASDIEPGSTRALRLYS